MKRLYRDEFNGMLGGVCSGISDYMNIDVSLIRIIFFILLLINPVFLLIYLMLWLILPG